MGGGMRSARTARSVSFSFLASPASGVRVRRPVASARLLEGLLASCFLCRVSRASGSLRVRIACIALAGTVGAMGMLGYRRGGAVELFAAGGHLLFTRAAPVLASVIGVVIHGLWMLLWAVILVALARHHGFFRASLEAAAIAAVAFAAALTLPSSLIGPVATLTIGERALVHVVLGISLMLGMRLAPLGDAGTPRRVSPSEERWLA